MRDQEALPQRAIRALFSSRAFPYYIITIFIIIVVLAVSSQLSEVPKSAALRAPQAPKELEAMMDDQEGAEESVEDLPVLGPPEPDREGEPKIVHREDPKTVQISTILKKDSEVSNRKSDRPAADFRPVPVEFSTAFVLLAHDRYDYIKRTLEGVLKTDNVEKYTIFVSVDREHLVENVEDTLKSISNPRKVPIKYLTSELPFADAKYGGEPSITRHMASVFHQVFKLKQFEYVIILEDDLEVSTDFFNYFASVGEALHPFHQTARNLYCVSAWNDNGFNHLNLDASRVFRTDWYPGLGVMFHRSMWVNKMEYEWPVWDTVEWGYDNWLRYRSTIAKSNDCLAPEVSRTHHYGRNGMHVGASAAPLYERMTLSDGKTQISQVSLTAALTPLSMRAYYRKLISESEEVSFDTMFSRNFDSAYSGKSVVVYFENNNDLRDPGNAKRISAKFNLFPFQFRMKYRGLFSFKVSSTSTHVTMVAASMRDYWSADI
jgi:hypothetical protein